MATTFATNHIRQIGVGLAHELRRLRTGNPAHRKKLLTHFEILLFFFAGTVVGTVACNTISGSAILLALLPLGIIFARLLHADLTTEKALLEKKPAGH